MIPIKFVTTTQKYMKNDLCLLHKLQKIRFVRIHLLSSHSSVSVWKHM